MTKNFAEIPYNNSDKAPPRYDLSHEELMVLEQDLVGEVRSVYPEEGMVAAWIWPDHRFANVLRSHEAELFPEVSDLPQDIEDRSLFFALIDLREGANRVVHSTTLSGVLGRKAGELNPEDPEGPTTSGFIVIDDLIEMGNFTVEEFWDYYKKRGIDLANTVSVETNFRVGDRVSDYKGVSTTDIALFGVYKFATSIIEDPTSGTIFTSANKLAQGLFERVGIVTEPLMGRTDLVTPESLEGLEYTPLNIINNPQTYELFQSLDIAVPEIRYMTED